MFYRGKVRKTEDEKITSALNDEATNRVNADNTLKKNIDDEVKARTTAITTVTSSVNAIDARLKTLENETILDFGTY